MVKLDWADVGNLVLGIGTGVSGYVSTFDIKLGVLVLSLAGIGKAFCSALDNYQFKQAQANKPTTPSS